MRYVQASGTTFLRHVIDHGEPTVWDENNTVRASQLTPAEATTFGVSKLKLVTPPPYNPLTQVRTDADAVLVDGVWTQQWVVSDKPVDEVEQAKQFALNSLRLTRDGELQACDYTQLSDVTLTTEKRVEWATYRQQLRDYMGTVIDPFNPPAWPRRPQN